MIKLSETKYVSPRVKTIEINPRAIICLSPDGMRLIEKDLGDGSLTEE